MQSHEAWINLFFLKMIIIVDDQINLTCEKNTHEGTTDSIDIICLEME